MGAVLEAPACALRDVAARRGGSAGFRDALGLIALGVLALHADALARELAVAARLDLRGGLLGALRVVAQAGGVDLAAILVGSLALTVASPRARRDSARDVDLAACAWMPSLALRVAAGLAAAAGAPEGAAHALVALGWLWSAALLVLAVRVVRA
ncbi:MAG: hypothetical protein AABZ30_02085 [Myxococcota bacterium]